MTINKIVRVSLLVGATMGCGMTAAWSQSAAASTVDHSAFNGIWAGRAKTVTEGIAEGYPISLGTTGWAPLSMGDPAKRPLTNFDAERSTVEKLIAADGDVFVYMASKRHKPNYTPEGEKAALAKAGGAAAGPNGPPIASSGASPAPVPAASADPYARCLPRNTVGFDSGSVGFGSAMEIFVAKDHVGVVSEDQKFRTIRLNADASQFTPTYNGISIGHWQGASLVVVTTGYLGDSGGENWPMSDQAKVTDTFTLSADKKVLKIKTIYEDPKYLREPMAEMVYLDRAKPNYEFLSSSCVEEVQGAATYAQQFGSAPSK